MKREPLYDYYKLIIAIPGASRGVLKIISDKVNKEIDLYSEFRRNEILAAINKKLLLLNGLVVKDDWNTTYSTGCNRFIQWFVEPQFNHYELIAITHTLPLKKLLEITDTVRLERNVYKPYAFNEIIKAIGKRLLAIELEKTLKSKTRWSVKWKATKSYGSRP